VVTRDTAKVTRAKARARAKVTAREVRVLHTCPLNNHPRCLHHHHPRPNITEGEAHPTAYNAYTIKAVLALINYYHMTIGSPPIPTWINRINSGYFTGWPGLMSSDTAPRIRRQHMDTRNSSRRISSQRTLTLKKETASARRKKRKKRESPPIKHEPKPEKHFFAVEQFCFRSNRSRNSCINNVKLSYIVIK